MVNLYYGGRRRLDRISIGQIWRPGDDKKRDGKDDDSKKKTESSGTQVGVKV
jgi:hypothetical protein